MSDSAPEATEEDGVVERVVDHVEETARAATTFVTRLGGAFSEGFQDGRERS